MKVEKLAEKFEVLVGDTSLDKPEKFIVECLNWTFNELPRVPKLEKIFSKHYTKNLDAKDHYRWDLNGDFRRLSDIPMITFWTSTGGEPCQIRVCNEDVVSFYKENGLPYLRKAGMPQVYTIEQEDDNTYLVLDRPLDIPMIVDYIAYGYPKPVSSFDDTIELSAIAENLILSIMRGVFYWESEDFSFAQSILEYADNKAVREAIQAIHREFSSNKPIILGEA